MLATTLYVSSSNNTYVSQDTTTMCNAEDNPNAVSDSR